jgi:hypothetical protein
LIGDEKAEKISANGLTVGFAVEDLDEKIAMLDSRRVPHSGVISPVPDVRFVFFTDLNGCGIQLLEGN